MIKEQQEAMSRHRSIRIPLPRQQEERRAKRRRHETEEEEEASAVVVKLVERIQQIEAQELQEQPASGHYALFMWPSAMVLAHFIAQRSQLFEHKVVMELGCGTALPGILTALCAHPKQVYLTDRSDVASIRQNVQANINLNGVGHCTRFLPLDWGRCSLPEECAQAVDIIIAADCFYQSEDFEKVLVTVALLFRRNPYCRFYVTYQLRSINRTIAPLLLRWGMTAKVIDKQSFLDQQIDEQEDSSSFENVYLYEIAPIQ